MGDTEHTITGMISHDNDVWSYSNWSEALLAASAPATWTLTTAQLPSHNSHSTGISYEAAGPQKADAPPSFNDVVASVIADAEPKIIAALKGLSVDHAISALHGQHTRNGRPLRYMPELD